MNRMGKLATGVALILLAGCGGGEPAAPAPTATPVVEEATAATEAEAAQERAEREAQEKAAAEAEAKRKAEAEAKAKAEREAEAKEQALATWALDAQPDVMAIGEQMGVISEAAFSMDIGTLVAELTALESMVRELQAKPAPDSTVNDPLQRALKHFSDASRLQREGLLDLDFEKVERGVDLMDAGSQAMSEATTALEKALG